MGDVIYEEVKGTGNMEFESGRQKFPLRCPLVVNDHTDKLRRNLSEAV